MADLFDVMLHQRACRTFDPDAPVDDGDVDRILTAATHAPSPENTQPWAFVVVRDPGTRAALAGITERAWTGFVEEHVTRTHADQPRLLADVRAGMADGGFAAAPVVVVVCADTTRADKRSAATAVYPATQNLLLAANALGYGSCLTTLTTFFADELRSLLDLPDTAVPMTTVYLGRPARPLGPPRRRPLGDVVHRERW